MEYLRFAEGIVVANPNHLAFAHPFGISGLPGLKGRIDVRAFPDNGKPTLKGIQLAIDELAKENPKAKNVTPQQAIDLSLLP